VPYGDIKRGFELAHPLGHVPTVNNQLVQRRLEQYRLPARDTGNAAHAKTVRELLVPVDTLPGAERNVRYLMAVDGSDHEEEIDSKFPSSRSLFLQIAGILIDLQELRVTRHGYPDPAAIADAQDAAVFAGFLPGSNLPSRDGEEPVRAFRRELHTLLKETTVNGLSLLTAFQGLNDLRTQESLSADKQVVCPNDGCEQTIEDVAIDIDGASCPGCGRPLWLTDLLRMHDEFNPWGENRSVAGRVRNVLEHMTLAALASGVLKKTPAAFDNVAFIADGPLAIFGSPARMRLPLMLFWQRTINKARTMGLEAPLVMGIEKSGEFIDHARDLDELIEPGHVMHLTTQYIGEHIRRGRENYGVGTYFGRKFVYRTTDERLIVFTIPPLALDAHGQAPYGPGGEALTLDAYPTLGATCRLLDVIGTRLYEDAVIPLALAHRWAAYPLRTASSVLRIYAEERLRSGDVAPSAAI
jgi:hypothetical protein